MASLKLIARAVLLSSLALAQLMPSTYDTSVGNITTELIGSAGDTGSVDMLKEPERVDWPTWAPANFPKGVDRRCMMIQTGGNPQRCHNSKDCDFYVFSRNYTESNMDGDKNQCARGFHHYLWKESGCKLRNWECVKFVNDDGKNYGFYARFNFWAFAPPLSKAGPEAVERAFYKSHGEEKNHYSKELNCCMSSEERCQTNAIGHDPPPGPRLPEPDPIDLPDLPKINETAMWEIFSDHEYFGAFLKFDD